MSSPRTQRARSGRWRSDPPLGEPADQFHLNTRRSGPPPLQTRAMKLPVLLLALALPLAVRADDYEARTFTGADGAKLGYRLLSPKNYDKAQKYPLVVFLHGAGERGDDNGAQLR